MLCRSSLWMLTSSIKAAIVEHYICVSNREYNSKYKSSYRYKSIWICNFIANNKYIILNYDGEFKILNIVNIYTQKKDLVNSSNYD